MGCIYALVNKEGNLHQSRKLPFYNLDASGLFRFNRSFESSAINGNSLNNPINNLVFLISAERREIRIDNDVILKLNQGRVPQVFLAEQFILSRHTRRWPAIDFEHLDFSPCWCTA